MLIHVILFIKRHPGSWDMLFSGAVRLTDMFLDKNLRPMEEEKTAFGFTGDDTTHGWYVCFYGLNYIFIISYYHSYVIISF